MVNFVTGVGNSNALPVEVSEAGAVEVFNNTGGGRVHVRGVVLGYYIPEDPAAGLEFIPVTPCAVFDTRPGGTAGNLGPGSSRAFQVAGTLPAGQVGAACAPPAEAVAVHLNLVALEAEAVGNLQIAEDGVDPQGGVVNFTPNADNSNAVPVEVSAADALRVFDNAAAGVDVRGVALGYYVTAAP